jgi:hypothetical protein
MEYSSVGDLIKVDLKKSIYHRLAFKAAPPVSEEVIEGGSYFEEER